MNIYIAVNGQSLLDVCLIVYGSLDFIVKLANDNGIADLSNCFLSGIAFVYDNTLIINQVATQQLNNQYGTGVGAASYYIPENAEDYYTDENGNIYIPE